MLDEKTVTDFYIRNQIITWEKAIQRIVIYSPPGELIESEKYIKQQLENWVSENNLTLIDVEFISGLIRRKEELFSKYINCCRCPQYNGPFMEEIRTSLAFEEIKDKRLRWFLSDYFHNAQELTSEQYDSYKNYVLYFSPQLFIASACPKALKDESRQELLSIPKRYWIMSRRLYGCPAIAVCSKVLYKITDYWYGIDPDFYPKAHAITIPTSA